jgi:uncharacterized membrane protein
MSWQLPLFLNIVFGTIRSYLDKKLVERLDPLVVYVCTVFWMTGFLLLYYLAIYHRAPAVYPEMMVLGILYAVAIGSYLKAIKINLSQSVVFSSYYLVIPMVLSAIFLGEWSYFNPNSFSGQKTIVGLILAFVSMFLILRSHTKKEAKMELTWVYLIIINIVLNGIGTYWGKTFVNTHGPFDTIFSQCLGALPVVILINYFGKKKYHLTPTNHILVALDGLIITLAVAFYYLAIQRGPLTLILPIQTLLGSIAIVTVGLVLFQEGQHLGKEKIAGLVIGIIGIMLLVI